ncbi:MAG: hypothetical protein V1703_03550 [Candidatus Altiarchaeota archaeon]
MKSNNKKDWILLSLSVITLLAFVANASADIEVVNIKSDSTWKASSTISSTDWFKLEFDDSNWGTSTGRWPNNPCTKYCGKMTSCELTCVDWMWYNQSCTNCETYYRKTINLPEEVTAGTITITADNYYWLYVNGNFISSDTTKSGFQKAETYDITKFLLPGKNVISIKAQNDLDNEGVALTGEIKYTTYNTLINQLQGEIDGLEYQVNSLSNDKNRLQTQVDTLQQQVKNLTTSKDQLTSENSGLQIENLELKNNRNKLETTLEETQSSLDNYRILNIVLIFGLLAAIGTLIAVLYYFYNKLKGRRPRLSEPAKRMPTERVDFEREITSLSEEKPSGILPGFEKKQTEVAPAFERKRTSTLSSLGKEFNE